MLIGNALEKIKWLTTKNKVATAGIGYTIGNLLIKGIAFVTTPVFSRLLGPENYGIVNSYIAYETFLTVIISLLLQSSIRNAKYEMEDRFNQYISNIIGVIWINATIIILLVIVFQSKVTSFIGFPILVVILLVLHSVGDSLIYIYNAFVALSYEYKKYLAISVFNAIFSLLISLLLVITALMGDGNLAFGRIVGYSAPLVILNIFFTWYFWKKEKPNFSKMQLAFAYKYCLPLIPFGLADVSLSQFSRLVIQKVIGVNEMGIYSLSYNIYSIVGVVRNSLDNVWGPWFFEQMHAQKLDAIRKRSVQYAALIGGFSIALMLFTPEIVWIMGDADYYDAIYSVVPLVAASYFVFLFSLPIQAEYYMKKTILISIGTISVAAINILVTYITVSKFGYILAAYCTLVSYILLSIYHFVISQVLLRRDIYNLKILILESVIVLSFIPISLALLDHRIIRYIFIALMVLLQGKILVKRIRKTK